MIEQLELNWSRFGHPSFDWDSEWKSIIQDKKSSYELCHNQSKDTYSIICQDKEIGATSQLMLLPIVFRCFNPF